MNKRRDVIGLGAQAMTTRDLLQLAGVKDDELAAAEQGMALLGAARDQAIRTLRSGPRLLAALELGRRAWMLPSPVGRRVRAPVDVAAVCAPRFADGRAQCLALALDKRMTIARIEAIALEPGWVLRATLGAGVTRVVVALNRIAHRAVPTIDDTKLADALHAACRLVDVTLVDIVLLGDDGFASLAQLGIVAPSERERRYR